jgi:hypothetical protein
MGIIKNERAWNGVPKMSGSSVYENMLCKARFKASQKFKDYDTSDATQGTELHSYMENSTPVDEILDSSHAFIITECRRMEAEVTKIFGLQGVVSREPRLWLLDENGTGILSGQIDYLEIEGENASILDYKMLYGNYEEASKNKQLQVYATLVMQNYPEVQTVRVALLQPALGKLTHSVIDRTSSEILAKKMLRLSTEVEADDAPMTAGSMQCKYCKALAHCPAAFKLIKNEIDKETDMENISNEELAKKMELVGLIERFGKSVKATAKSRLESDIDLPGWKLRNTGSVTSFDAVGAAEILFSANLPVKEFLQATKISEPDLIKIWASHTDQSIGDSKKDLRTRLEQVMFRKAKSKSVSAK